MSFSGTKGHLTKPKPGVQINPLHPLSKGLVGYWLFNEGTGSRISDISGKCNHGTLKNMPPNTQNSGWSGCKFGGELEFDGTDDYVHLGGNISLHPPHQTISINMTWTTSNTCAFHYTSKQDFYISAGGIYCWLNDGTDKRMPSAGVAGSGLNDGLPHTISVSSNGITSKLYVDGIEKTSLSVGDLVSTSAMMIGKPGSNTLSGSVNYYSKYDRALPSEEIKILHQDPFCNLLQIPIRRYFVAAPPVGVIMNQFQRTNLGADLYNGVFA